MSSSLDHLPLNPPWLAYSFGLDAEYMAEEGVWFAFNQIWKSALDQVLTAKLASENKGNVIVLIRMFKDAVKVLNKY